ncbi:inositol 1,4,5-triphosphate receptor associated 1 isoform X2 [Rana temporaria]|uniref:inositol 1,4,5-triphosphate receptor associated 1 isoform X2 n=1 Tax=Rana temporaria TaxID=8407 RepID=UPI001AACCDFA|nr:inositol 1,4,5-triphosphate receptor associated 1 isoform X2 [Rana temporaria]
MPTVPGNQELAAEGQHPPTPTPARELEMGGRACIPPAIILPEPDFYEGNCLEKNPPHSPSFRSGRQSRSSSSSTGSLISVDNKGHVIDLVHDSLPDIRITEEDKKKNLEILEEAKKVSEKFLTRRGRRSRCSLSDSPTASSPSLSPKVSPVSSRSNSFTFPPVPGPDPYNNVFPSAAAIMQNATKGFQQESRKISQGRLTPRPHTLAASKETLSEQKENFDPLKHVTIPPYKAGPSDVSKPSPCKPLNSPDRDSAKPILKKPKDNDPPPGSQAQPPGVSGGAFLVPGSNTVPADSRLEHASAGSRPPLLRALSWDSLDPEQKKKSSLDLPDKETFFHDKSNNKLSKFTGLKDFHIQPVRLQKLTKLREEHKMMRSQNLLCQKLPELSEAAEQERGSSPVHENGEEDGEEVKEKSDVMPHIPDILLRKLRIHKSLPTSAPPLTEKEVENVFVQLSLAFRNDSYTLESRLNQAERERNLTEDNNEKEIETFRTAVMSSVSIWQNSEHREAFQKLLEDIAVLHRLTTRLSSRAEMVGAVRQEKRMSKATEVMMQYVENLKRTYEKDHAELMEYKKLANQNSSRNYSGSDDGVPRSSRSMSLTIGKNMPRRRVSVAVVPKFNLLNIPGQSPNSSPISALSSLAESPNSRNSLPTTPTLSPLSENVKSGVEMEGSEVRTPSLIVNSPEELSAEIKAKIEEDAYNKGFQEGLKKVQGLQEFKEEEEEKVTESPTEYEEEEKEEFTKLKSSKIEECLDYIHMLYPKLLNHWSALSIVAAAIVFLAVLLSVYNAVSTCTEPPDGGGHNKATCSLSQKYSWWTSGSPHKQRRQ